MSRDLAASRGRWVLAVSKEKPAVLVLSGLAVLSDQKAIKDLSGRRVIQVRWDRLDQKENAAKKATADLPENRVLPGSRGYRANLDRRAFKVTEAVRVLRANRVSRGRKDQKDQKAIPVNREPKGKKEKKGRKAKKEIPVNRESKVRKVRREKKGMSVKTERHR